MSAQNVEYDAMLPTGVMPAYSDAELARLREWERAAINESLPPHIKSFSVMLCPVGALRGQYSLYRRNMHRWPYMDWLAAILGLLIFGATIVAITYGADLITDFAFPDAGNKHFAPINATVGMVAIVIAFGLAFILLSAGVFLSYLIFNLALFTVRVMTFGNVLAVQRDESGRVVAMRDTMLPRMAFAARADWGWVSGKAHTTLVIECDTLPATDRELLTERTVYCAGTMR